MIMVEQRAFLSWAKQGTGDFGPADQQRGLTGRSGSIPAAWPFQDVIVTLPLGRASGKC